VGESVAILPFPQVWKTQVWDCEC